MNIFSFFFSFHFLEKCCNNLSFFIQFSQCWMWQFNIWNWIFILLYRWWQRDKIWWLQHLHSSELTDTYTERMLVPVPLSVSTCMLCRFTNFPHSLEFLKMLTSNEKKPQQQQQNQSGKKRQTDLLVESIIKGLFSLLFHLH